MNENHFFKCLKLHSKKLLKLFLVVTLIFSVGSIMAQNGKITVKGKVTSGNGSEALIGVSVLEK